MLQDHEVLIEKKRYELEHRPVQKQVCCLYKLDTPAIRIWYCSHGPSV
jgi:hypothetical protein